MDTLNVGVVQFAPSQDKEENLETIAGYVERGAERDVDLLVFPEFALFTAPAMDDRFVESAEPLNGPSVSVLCELSSKHDLSIVCGFNESAEAGKIHNTVIGIRDGVVAAVYRKVHLYDAFGFTESLKVHAAPADQPPSVLEIGSFRVALQTCYDIRFPEVSRRLIDAGADLLALPAEWVPGPLKEFHWTALLQARAIENTVYVAAANQTQPTGTGLSMILDPMGTTAATLSEEQGLTVAALDKDRLHVVRRSNPALELRKYRVLPAEG